MTGLIAAEAIKLRGTRSVRWLALAAAVVATAVSATVAATVEPSTRDAGTSAFAASGIVLAFCLIIGVLGPTSEFRHGTVVSTLLVTPNRTRLLAAKALVHATAAALLGLAVFGLGAAAVLPLLDSRGIATGLSTAHLLGVVVGGALGSAAFAVIGVAVGTLVRNQAGGLVLCLGWLYVGEQVLALVPAFGDAVRRFGLAGLASGVTGTAGPDPSIDLLGQLPAALLLTALAAALLLAAVASGRRDIVAR